MLHRHFPSHSLAPPPFHLNREGLLNEETTLLIHYLPPSKMTSSKRSMSLLHTRDSSRRYMWGDV